MEVLSPEEAARHRAVLQGQEADFGKDGLPRPIGQYHRVNAHLVSEMACATALDSRILDAVESLLGPDLMLWSCEYFIKEAQTDKIVSWHQDLTYWGMGDRSRGDRLAGAVACQRGVRLHAVCSRFAQAVDCRAHRHLRR